VSAPVSTLVIGVGNTLRGDDGVAARVLELLEARAPGAFVLKATLSLLPELADDLVAHARVIFVDADVLAREVTLRPVEEERAGLHRFAPWGVVAMARSLGFLGEAWVCSLPVEALGAGEGLSPAAVATADEAVERLLADAGER
jgi:hydrogenase maturation protease